MIHKYTEQDTRRCNRLIAFLGKDNHFLFLGDKRMKQLFDSFVNHFQSKGPNESSNELEYIDSKLKLRVTFVPAGDLKTMLSTLDRLQKEPDPPNFIISSSKFINLSLQVDKSENYTKELEKTFIKNITLLISPIDALVRKQTKVLWKLQDPIDDNLNDPPSEWKDVSNSDIEHFNQIISDTLKYSSVSIWRSGTQIAYGLIDEMKDGFKLGPIALKHDIQILLNIYCNDNMNYNDGTCCSTSENYTILQIITYSLFLVCLAVMLGLFLKKSISKFRGQTLYMPLQQDSSLPPINATNRIQDLIITQGILGIIMVYFYLCDRTNFFMKENKYYSEFSFWIPLCWLSAVGLFFTDDSKFTRVMHRDQTDEMKGFMIIVVLIYYMTGATRGKNKFLSVTIKNKIFLFQ